MKAVEEETLVWQALKRLINYFFEIVIGKTGKS